MPVTEDNFGSYISERSKGLDGLTIIITILLGGL